MKPKNNVFLILGIVFIVLGFSTKQYLYFISGGLFIVASFLQTKKKAQ